MRVSRTCAIYDRVGPDTNPFSFPPLTCVNCCPLPPPTYVRRLNFGLLLEDLPVEIRDAPSDGASGGHSRTFAPINAICHGQDGVVLASANGKAVGEGVA